MKELESELDSEQRRYQDSLKISNKQERTARDIQFNIDENRKNQAQTQDLIDKLQQKIKTYKKQVEEAVSLHLNSFYLSMLSLSIHIFLVVFRKSRHR